LGHREVAGADSRSAGNGHDQPRSQHPGRRERHGLGSLGSTWSHLRAHDLQGLANPVRRRDRHARVHVARAGPGPACRRASRHLFTGRDSVRDLVRAGSVRARGSTRDRKVCNLRDADATELDSSVDASRARSAHAAYLGQRPCRADADDSAMFRTISRALRANTSATRSSAASLRAAGHWCCSLSWSGTSPANRSRKC